MSLPFFKTEIPEISVQELKALFDAGHTPFILDVRQPEEREVATIGGILIPLNELSGRLDELQEYKEEKIVIYCRSGARSARAVEYMRAFGFDHALNLKGGILAWSREIDPSVPSY